jgi:hypothetical protein
MQTLGSFPRDANYVPYTTYGAVTTKSLTLSANNTTANPPIFTLTGAVEVRALWGVVTTALGSNITAAYWRLNDQTAQVNISLNTGTTLSAFTVGSYIARSSVAGVALTGDNASAGKVRDPVAATAPAVLMPFSIVQKTAAVTTQIEFVYTTTNTPTSGVIQFFAGWFPQSIDGNLVAA